LFCRVIEKREEHQRNVQIYTIPETVPTPSKISIKEEVQPFGSTHISFFILSPFSATSPPLSVFLVLQQQEEQEL
jgi:hypothetical protein